MYDAKFASRVNELTCLFEDGWYDGRGKAVNPGAMLALAKCFNKFELKPYLYPTVEGGVQAEWTFPRVEVTLDISLPSLQAEYQSWDIDTDETVDVKLDLNKKSGWKVLITLLS
jgi:hypothetical protein